VRGIAALGELPPRCDHQRRRQLCRIGGQRAAAVVGIDALEPVDQRQRVVLGVASPRPVAVGHRDQQLLEARAAEPRLDRKVRAQEVRPAVGQAERRQRPAAALALDWIAFM